MIASTNIAQLREKYRSDNYIAFSVDTDWASEDCISEMLDFFQENRIPINVFCTHPSDVLAARRQDPLIELGIHPNYCPNSSHGQTIDEVTAYCMNLVPGARCIRTHRWFSSNDIYDKLVTCGIRYDSSECSMMDPVEPYIHRSGILRLPVYFEDGGLLWSKTEPDFARYGEKYFSGNGLKVLDLHPIHFAINSPTLDYYRQISDEMSARGEYTAMTKETARQLRFNGTGIRDYVMRLVEFIQAKRINVVSLGQIYEELEYYEGEVQ